MGVFSNGSGKNTRFSIVALAAVPSAASAHAAEPRRPSASPVVWGHAEPDRIVAGTETTVLHWGSANATHCSYAGNNYPTRGTARVGPYPEGRHSATFSCSNGAREVFKTIRWTAYAPDPEPEVFASVSPASVYTGQTATLSWYSTNAASCSRGGTSDSVSVGPWSTPGIKSLSVTCTGAGGRSTGTTRVTVNRLPPRPVITADLSPAVIEADTGAAEGTWSSTNADYCTYNGNRIPVGGSRTLGPYAAGARTFTFTCTGPGGTSLPETLSLRILRPPTVAVTVSPSRVNAGTGRATLTWSSTNADSCSRGGRTLPVSGSESVGPFTNNTDAARAVTLTVTCTNDLRSENGSASITVDPVLPTVTTTVSPETVSAGTGAAILTWSSTNADSCSRNGRTLAASGSESIGPFNNTTSTARTVTLTITCTNNFGSADDSATLTVAAPPRRQRLNYVQNFTGFDSHYKAWGKPRSNDFFIARDPSAPGNGGVVGFYLREATTGKTSDHFYNLEYPVTHAAAKADGFIVESSLSLKLHDVNLDGRADLIINGLRDVSLSRWDMIVYAGAGTGSFPAGYTEMGSVFQQMMLDLNSWAANENHFHDNAVRHVVPMARQVLFLSAPHATRPTTFPDECRSERTFCDAVYGDSDLPTDPAGSGFRYDYTSQAMALTNLRDIIDDELLRNFWYTVKFRFPRHGAVDVVYTLVRDYSVFNGADEIADDIDIIRESEHPVLDDERDRAEDVLRGIFGPRIGEVGEVVYKDSFFMTLSLWASSFAAEAEDVVGDDDLDEFIISLFVRYQLNTLLEVGQNEHAICVIRNEAGDLDVLSNDGTVLIEGESDSKLVLGDPDNPDDGDCIDPVAVLHTHPHSNWHNISNLGYGAPQEEADFINAAVNACRELPGPEDHLHIINRLGAPNYYVTPTGAIRVLERVNGVYKVRTVQGEKFNGATLSAESFGLYPLDEGYETYSVPPEGLFKTSDGECNPTFVAVEEQ